jgi:hypothetical protein
MAKAYAEKLKDPRWQRKRLEIFQRDGWECIHCGSSRRMLCCHHVKYIEGLEPWEYPDDLLLTLCETCHDMLKGVRPGSVMLCGGGGYSYDGRCPWCGSSNVKDVGSFDKCLDCGERIDFFPPEA